jgi:hypothetical protein
MQTVAAFLGTAPICPCGFVIANSVATSGIASSSQREDLAQPYRNQFRLGASCNCYSLFRASQHRSTSWRLFATNLTANTVSNSYHLQLQIASRSKSSATNWRPINEMPTNGHPAKTNSPECAAPASGLVTESRGVNQVSWDAHDYLGHPPHPRLL